MNIAEILAALPKLSPDECGEILTRVCELEVDEQRRRANASESERRMLDHALAEFEQDQDLGRPWHEVMNELRGSSGT